LLARDLAIFLIWHGNLQCGFGPLDAAFQSEEQFGGGAKKDSRNDANL
jgi:hypothetical protein